MSALDLLLAQTYLKELHALTDVRRAIVAHCTEASWQYCLAALDARLLVLRDLLAREDPHLLRTYEAERTAEAARPDLATAPTLVPRVH